MLSFCTARPRSVTPAWPQTRLPWRHLADAASITSALAACASGSSATAPGREPAADQPAEIVETWRVQRTRLPTLLRRCPDCTGNKALSTGKFRVNANGKLLDVWLLIRCMRCERNARIKVHHRTNVKSFDRARLRGYTENDLDLAAAVLLDPLIARRNHYSLDWTDAWELTAPNLGRHADRPRTVRVMFEVSVPIRPVRLIADGLELSRAELERLITSQRITSTIDLRRKTSSNFDFVVMPGSP